MFNLGSRPYKHKHSVQSFVARLPQAFTIGPNYEVKRNHWDFDDIWETVQSPTLVILRMALQPLKLPQIYTNITNDLLFDRGAQL
jgi:hypothetical protein